MILGDQEPLPVAVELRLASDLETDCKISVACMPAGDSFFAVVKGRMFKRWSSFSTYRSAQRP